MTDAPDRVSTDPKSPFFVEDFRRIRVSLNGIERARDVNEYCVSEGWIDVRIPSGRILGSRFMKLEDGSYRTRRLLGEVRAWYREIIPVIPAKTQEQVDAEQVAIRAMAEERRARKNAKRIGQ